MPALSVGAKADMKTDHSARQRAHAISILSKWPCGPGCINTARAVAESFGYQEYEAPILESLALYAATIRR